MNRISSTPGFAFALVGAVLATLLPVAPASAVVPGAGMTVQVSLDPTGVPADRAAFGGAVSADGRYVAFSSTASNLGGGTSGVSQVFVRDLLSGTTRLVSSFGDGYTPANRDAIQPSISSDGRFVAFSSAATNVDVYYAGSTRQIFVRDLAPGGRTRLASTSARGPVGGIGDSSHPSISADGTRVAFDSTSFDLAPGVPAVLQSQVYVADLSTSPSVVSLASVQDRRAPTPSIANAESTGAAISADGSTVAFESEATNLTADVPIDDTTQVFVHRTDGSTRMVSSAAGAAVGGGSRSSSASLSSDGSKVAFVSKALNLVAGPAITELSPQVYYRDLSASSAVLVSTGAGVPGNGESEGPSISADGSRVAFASLAFNLTPVDARGFWQVYLRDVRAAATTTVSTTLLAPGRGAGQGARFPSLSADGASVAFVSDSPDLTATSGENVSVYLRSVRAPRVERVSGVDRYAGAAAVSASAFDPGVPVAYVASGADFPDALAGSAAAGFQRAPVLLVTKDTIPAPVGVELSRLRPGRIVILGGFNTIGSGVETALTAFSGRVSRLAGADRYEGSAVVSREVFPVNSPVAYVASGAVFPDALAGSAAAGKEKGPVLLVGRDGISDAVRAELTRLHPGRIVVLGGPSTVPDAVVTQLGAYAATTIRLAGPDRYAGSAVVSAAGWPTGSGTVYVASGAVFPDALSGSAAAITNGAPVLLVTPTSIPAEVQAELTRLKPTHIVVLGGPNTVSDGVVTALDTYLAR